MAVESKSETLAFKHEMNSYMIMKLQHFFQKYGDKNIWNAYKMHKQKQMKQYQSHRWTNCHM